MLNADSGLDVPERIRRAITDAVATLDPGAVVDVLIEEIQALLSPQLIAGFALDGEAALTLRRFVIDEDSSRDLPSEFDFDWLEPLLVPDASNGASLIGPDCGNLTQMAATLTAGDGRFAYLVVVGAFEDPEHARQILTSIASEGGHSIGVIVKASERAADVVASQERERLSRDLHDSLSQSLWSLSILSETAGSMVATDDPLHAVIRQIAEISLTSQEEMRSLLINLRSDESDPGRVRQTLEALLSSFALDSGLHVQARIDDVELDASTMMAIQRVAAEALNNVARHSGASGVAVSFEVESDRTDPERLTLRIQDDGQGFDGLAREGHLGLRIMRERSAEIGCELDVQSSAAGGTTIIVDNGRGEVPVLDRPVVADDDGVNGRWLVWGAASLLFALLAVVGFVGSQARHESANEAEEIARRTELVEHRTSLIRSELDLLTVDILVSAALAAPLQRSVASSMRDAEYERGRQVASEVIGTEGEAAEDAGQLIDSIDRWRNPVAAIPRPFLIYGAIWDFETIAAGTLEGEIDQFDSISNLATLDQLVMLAVHEAVVARYAVAPEDFSPSADLSGFLTSSASLVDATSNFLGPEPGQPIGAWHPPAANAAVHEVAAVAELNRLVGSSLLLDETRWTERWASGSLDAPPNSLDQFLTESIALSDETRTVVDQRVAEFRATMTADASRDRLFARLLWVLAALALLALLWSLRIVLRAGVGRSRRTLAQSSLDPLTGVSNRKALTREVAPRLADDWFDHHIVVTIDMDRFKLVNDGYGHATGDAVLEAIGAGLARIAASDVAGAGSAVRLGGDEFLLSLHGEDVIPEHTVRRLLDRLSSTLVSSSDGTLVRASFSYGLVVVQGSPDLGDVMQASDLEAYREKAGRYRASSITSGSSDSNQAAAVRTNS